MFVRIAGLTFIQLGLFDLYYIVARTLGFQTASQIPLSRIVQAFVLYCGWGIVLIVAAKLIVRVTYWQDRRE
jgi:hypothetical protein